MHFPEIRNKKIKISLFTDSMCNGHVPCHPSQQATVEEDSQTHTHTHTQVADTV